MSRLGVQAQKCVQPVGPSYAAPSTVTTAPASPGSATDADRREALGQVGAGREGGHDRVVVAATEDELHRVDAQRGADGLHRLGELEGVRGRMSMATPESAAMWPTSATSPSETSIIAVAPAWAAASAGGVRRLGALVGLDQRPG